MGGGGKRGEGKKKGYQRTMGGNTLTETTI